MTRAPSHRASILAAVLAGCTSTPSADPAPTKAAAPSEVRAAAPPAGTNPPTAAADQAAEPRTAPAPADPELPWKNLPAGVVPAAMVGDVTLASTDRPILARAAACDRPKLGDDCNYGAPEILGFDATGVALVYPPESGHPEVWPLVGELVGLDGTSRERGTITRTGELEGREYTAARLKGWKWFAKLARAGFTPARPLVRATSVVPHGDTGHAPVAFLNEPLAGWMLHAAAEGDQLVVQLVSPDNQRAHRLGTLPIEPGEQCIDEQGGAAGCAAPRKYALASVAAVALDPAQRHLVVLLSLSYGTSDEVLRTVWRIYPLPADVPIGSAARP